MFASTARRLRAILDLADEMLAHPEPEELIPHPHRRPVRVSYQRRRGSVAAPPAHCLSPVRPSSGVARRAKVR